MSSEARVTIDSHRLMHKEKEPEHVVHVDFVHKTVEENKQKSVKKWKLRASVHVGIFIVSFIFTTGILMLGIILWVKPDAFLAFVLVGIFASLIFVFSFAGLRLLLLHKLINENVNKEEDPGLSHHVSKSITYGFVALVFAIVLAGLIINIASADIIL